MRVAMGSDDRTPFTQSVLDELKRRGVEVELHAALQGDDEPGRPDAAFHVSRAVAKGAPVSAS